MNFKKKGLGYGSLRKRGNGGVKLNINIFLFRLLSIYMIWNKIFIIFKKNVFDTLLNISYFFLYCVNNKSYDNMLIT